MELFLVLMGHDFFNEVQTMCQVFYPNRKYVKVDYPSLKGVTVQSVIDRSIVRAVLFEDGEQLNVCETPNIEGETAYEKNAVKLCIYHLLSPHTGKTPKWGILTGIRPAKLVRQFYEKNYSREQIKDTFVRDYLVSNEKAELAINVCESELAVFKDLKDGPCLYVGIPFCPSKCLYCSFTSYPVKQYANKVDVYLECLIDEINRLPDFIPSSIYIGGGTPTSLNARLLDLLFTKISDKFNITDVEYTVEAGRPDTINEDVLRVMKAHGVTRLSINPQTMNERTLSAIGRCHSVKDVKNAFFAARKEGFNNINMDIIAGLPGETALDVEETMKEICGLNPESVTVHTLAVKRASRLKEKLSEFELSEALAIEDMLRVTEQYAMYMSMGPYYMYRQKNMLGNFENVGYCKRGYHCHYNVIIMEETKTVHAAGAGAITKIVEKDRISRKFNVKDVDEYIKRCVTNSF